MAWSFQAIDATLSPWPRRLDGVEVHEGPQPDSLVNFHTGPLARLPHSSYAYRSPGHRHLPGGPDLANAILMQFLSGA